MVGVEQRLAQYRAQKSAQEEQQKRQQKVWDWVTLKVVRDWAGKTFFARNKTKVRNAGQNGIWTILTTVFVSR